MKNNEFEKTLKKALELRAENIEPSPYMLQKIKSEVKTKSRREILNMKFLSTKKIAVIGVLCLVSVSCYAASKLNGSVSHSTHNIKTYESIADRTDEIGFTPNYIEKFDNGYEFAYGGTGSSQGVDENNERTGKEYPMINITYKNDEGKWVSLSAENGNVYADEGEKVEEGYSIQEYKFVPADYELTDDDEKAMADGSLMISYGTEKVELNTMESYIWTDGDIYYSLTAEDCEFGEEEMAHMVDQVMGR